MVAWPSFETASSVLHYDPAGGIFTWKVRRGRQSAGTRAGCIKSGEGGGYWQVKVLHKLCRGNRLAWLFMTGEWPHDGYEVDHINRIRSDDRWDNLRLALPHQNSSNTIKKIRSTSGVTGVYLHPDNGRFYPYIQVEGRLHKLGGYKTLAAAIEVRLEAQKQFFGEFAPNTEHTPPMEVSTVILAAPRPAQQELSL